MPLLDYITSTSMDADYAHVAARRGDTTPVSVRPGLAALVVTLLFGVLVATAAVQTSRNAADAQTGRASLVSQIKSRSEQVDRRRERVVTLRQEVDSLQTRYLDATTRGRSLAARLTRVESTTGAGAVTGPGVRVVVDDAPGGDQRVLDKDLQKLANALWVSGAEAISVNGQRLTTLSAIRLAGNAITVNGVSLAGPYTVLAVGDPDTMPARFVETDHGQDWVDLKTVFGLQFTMTTSEESLRLPAAKRLNLRHATAAEATP
jgi:uncharacterized protein YlxW (UPF0749 family)